MDRVMMLNHANNGGRPPTSATRPTAASSGNTSIYFYDKGAK